MRNFKIMNFKGEGMSLAKAQFFAILQATGQICRYNSTDSLYPIPETSLVNCQNTTPMRYMKNTFQHSHQNPKCMHEEYLEALEEDPFGQETSRLGNEHFKNTRKDQ